MFGSASVLRAGAVRGAVVACCRGLALGYPRVEMPLVGSVAPWRRPGGTAWTTVPVARALGQVRAVHRSHAVSRLTLSENDLEEAFVKGTGPGGQKINKVRNCVQLRHTPTGLTVAVQDGRSLTANRAIARKRLAEKVDLEMNGRESKLGKKVAKKQKQKDRNRRRAKKKAEMLAAAATAVEEELARG
uniref:Prokaryotic-type class I peptide chain release factors domain-containing protein n=1 Tax=Rhizochromulina marina TaxID=1034831 RepID=A0A7S2S280_9STRA|mmetsp:Transcript_2406/g.7007  ORF Transcript_2406/g.7007 Transcript_2406/m.7007 type:complete len:188 (+) Transcript_2406:317-880(+)